MKDFYFSFVRITIAQIICAFLIFAVLMGTKFLLKKEYKKVQNFYKIELLSETDPDEVLREEKGNGI